MGFGTCGAGKGVWLEIQGASTRGITWQLQQVAVPDSSPAMQPGQRQGDSQWELCITPDTGPSLSDVTVSGLPPQSCPSDGELLAGGQLCLVDGIIHYGNLRNYINHPRLPCS